MGELGSGAVQLFCPQHAGSLVPSRWHVAMSHSFLLWLVVFVAVGCWFRNNWEIILGNIAAATTKRNILSHAVVRCSALSPLPGPECSGYPEVTPLPSVLCFSPVCSSVIQGSACLLHKALYFLIRHILISSLRFAIMSPLAAILGCLQQLWGFLANFLVLWGMHPLWQCQLRKAGQLESVLQIIQGEKRVAGWGVRGTQKMD